MLNWCLKEKIRSKRWKINYNYRRYDGQGTAQQAPGKNFRVHKIVDSVAPASIVTIINVVRMLQRLRPHGNAMHPKSIRQERQAIRAAGNNRSNSPATLTLALSYIYIYIYHFVAFHFPSPTLRFFSSVPIGTPPPPAGIALQRKSSS